MGHDTDGIAGIDVTRNVVTAIDVVDMTCQHSDTGCITRRNVVRVIRRIQCHLIVWNLTVVITIVKWFYVCLTTTAINVINHHSCTFNLHEQSFRTGHTALITTSIEVADLTLLQVPSRTDSHISLVVTAEETTYLVFVTAGI